MLVAHKFQQTIRRTAFRLFVIGYAIGLLASILVLADKTVLWLCRILKTSFPKSCSGASFLP